MIKCAKAASVAKCSSVDLGLSKIYTIRGTQSHNGRAVWMSGNKAI